MRQTISRRDLLFGGVSTALVAAAPGPKRPNILFIMVDEMRWDAMSCAHHPVVGTPNLDRLASEGTRFANAYTVGPVCCPSRASVFSGRYVHVHGVTQNEMPAHDGEIFLPSILRYYGYHTAISGKLHYRPERFSYGFDQFWTFTREGPTPELGYMAFLQKKYGSPAKWPIVPGTCPWPDDVLGRDVGLFRYPEADYETDWIAAHALDYLRSRKDNPQPWFLFTSFLKPHSPSVEPKPYFDKYDPQTIPVPKLPPNMKEIRAPLRGQARRHFIDDEQMLRRISGIYYGAINHVDRHVGQILSELDRLGMANWKDRCYSQLATAMVRTPQWKFIDLSQNLSAGFELYDMRNDPKEERNLAAEPKNRDFIEDCKRQLTAWRADKPAPVKIAGMPTPDYAFISDQERSQLQRHVPERRQRRMRN